jgi:hypothetical protein
MIAWARTADGWAVNLDGSDAAATFSLPRLELHSGSQGWTAVCHLEGGATRTLAVGHAGGAAEARRAAAEHARSALGEKWEAAVRELLR